MVHFYGDKVNKIISNLKQYHVLVGCLVDGHKKSSKIGKPWYALSMFQNAGTHEKTQEFFE